MQEIHRVERADNQLVSFSDDFRLRVTLELEIFFIAEDIHNPNIYFVLNQFLLQRAFQIRFMSHTNNGYALTMTRRAERGCRR